MKIIYKLPSRSRCKKMFSCIDNIISMSKHDDYKIQLTLDYDDIDVIGDDVKKMIASYGGRVHAIYGHSENKIFAVNRDMEFSGDWDICCVHSDDFWITKPGFDQSIIVNMLTWFPDLDGVLHYPDQKIGKKFITYSILGRKYFERFNYLYYPYVSVYADNEFTDVAKILGRYKYVPENYLEHRHVRWGFGKPDALLQKTEDPMNYKLDRETYLKRKSNNFYL